MRGLFSDYTQLSPPEHVIVKNVVINEILAAVVAWDNSDDVDIFEGLGMSITLWTLHEKKSRCYPQFNIKWKVQSSATGGWFRCDVISMWSQPS